MNMDENNQAFMNMRRDAVKMLDGKIPEIIAENTGLTYDFVTQQFRLKSLGKNYTITYPDYGILEEMDSWHYLTILHYLNLADGAELSGKLCTFGDMPDGLVRGTNFDHTISAALAEFVTGHSESELLGIFRKIGGEVISSTADLSVRLWYLPRIPLTVNVWFADEEFPPSVRLMADGSIGHYLTIEDAVTMGDYLLRRLKKIRGENL